MSESKVPLILIAEDDDSVREVLLRHLQREGYRVEAAVDGEEAISIIEREPFVNLVITDVRMPGLTGVDVMRAAKKKSKDTEVIVITAYTDSESAVAAVREGAYDYLQKPFSYDADVATKVRHAIREQRLELQNREMLVRLEEMNMGLKDVLVRRTREVNDSQSLVTERLRQMRASEMHALAERLRGHVDKVEQAAAELRGEVGARVRRALAALRLEIEVGAAADPIEGSAEEVE